MAGEVTYLVTETFFYPSKEKKGTIYVFLNWTFVSIKLGFIIGGMSPKILIILRLFHSSHQRELYQSVFVFNAGFFYRNVH